MNLDFRQIVDGLRKRWWVALLVMMGAAAAAYLYTNAQQRIYQAQATLVVRCVPPENGCIEAVKKTMSAYGQELSSKVFWQQVLDENLIRDVDVNALAGQVKVQPLPDQNSIVMTVDNTDAARAASVADSIARGYVDRQNAENAALSAGGYRVVWGVTQAPEVPARPYQPRPLLYTGAAALFGLILGLLLAVVLELLDTTLKTPDEVSHYTGLNTLGVIPRSPVR